MSRTKKLVVKCPQCKKSFNYYDSDNRPFCTERCKLVDMGHWFEESYNVPGPPAHIPSPDEHDDEH